MSVEPEARTTAVRAIMEATALSEEVAEQAMVTLIAEGWAPNDGGMPDPQVWPECDQCGAAWVLRHAISVTDGKEVWRFFRDCKHRTAGHVMAGPGMPVG